jgi:hypothetical protein
MPHADDLHVSGIVIRMYYGDHARAIFTPFTALENLGSEREMAAQFGSQNAREPTGSANSFRQNLMLLDGQHGRIKVSWFDHACLSSNSGFLECSSACSHADLLGECGQSSQTWVVRNCTLGRCTTHAFPAK